MFESVRNEMEKHYVYNNHGFDDFHSRYWAISVGNCELNSTAKMSANFPRVSFFPLISSLRFNVCSKQSRVNI